MMSVSSRDSSRTTWCVLTRQRHTWKRTLVDGRLTIGHDAHCEVRLSDAGVAGRHVRLQRAGEGLEAVDLAGANRTTRHGQPCGPRPVSLQSGDVLRLGRTPVIVLSQSDGWLGLGDFRSLSPQMTPVFADLALSATTPWPVLLTGESGVGKELAARAVHDVSPRRTRPWVAVNCAALAGELVAAELFGAQKGAYTGAVENRKGAFERADGGTLFLDEIGELNLAAQAMLLRVLEVGEVQVLGGATRQVDVRVICATHRDLRTMVADGRFRLDLLHRLDVCLVDIPALRARPHDQIGLLRRFLPHMDLPEGTATLLARHPWPGNVRELRNVARRVELRAHGDRLRLADLAHLLGTPPAPVLRVLPGGNAGQTQARRALVAQLLGADVGVLQAWRQSGMPRGTFFRYAKEVRAAA